MNAGIEMAAKARAAKAGMISAGSMNGLPKLEAMAEVKVAVSVIALFIRMLVVFVVPLYEPEPVPTHFWNVCPRFAVSDILTLAPVLYHPL